jgi:hypothetical protein
VRELAGAGLAIGEAGAASLAGLRALMTVPRAAALRQAAVPPGARVLLIATEGRTGQRM